MGTLAERSIEVQKNIFAAFIEYEKAFDKVKYDEVMKDLEDMVLTVRISDCLITLTGNNLRAFQLTLSEFLNEWVQIEE